MPFVRLSMPQMQMLFQNIYVEHLISSLLSPPLTRLPIYNETDAVITPIIVLSDTIFFSPSNNDNPMINPHKANPGLSTLN